MPYLDVKLHIVLQTRKGNHRWGVQSNCLGIKQTVFFCTIGDIMSRPENREKDIHFTNTFILFIYCHHLNNKVN